MPNIDFEGPFEDEYPEDSEEERCGNPECEVCYPQENQQESMPVFHAPRPRFEWTFTTDSTTSIPFVDTTDEEVEETEGEEVPVNPEVIRPAPLPEDINGDIYFSLNGSRIEGGGTVSANTAVQISIWNLTPQRARLAYADLKEWMVENQFGVGRPTNEYFYDSDVSALLPYSFKLVEQGTRFYTDPAEVFSQPNCQCGAELEYPTLKCPDCESYLYCGTCRSFSDTVTHDEVYGSLCGNCGSICPDCEQVFHNSADRCSNCHPSTRCRACNDTIYLNDGEHISWQNARNGREYCFCSSCSDSLCRTCGTIVELDELMVDEDEVRQCIACVSRNSNEEWDENSELGNDELSIPTIPGREVIRLVGVEIEGANGEDQIDREGGNILARSLYDEGLSSSYEMGGYHSSSRSMVHVERDSSVDWEMVIGPLNVAAPSHVDILNRSVRIVRNHINNRTLKLDMRAGLHIHVGAANVPFHNAYNLHKLYMYMEDFLYRFGAAKWPYHRSINRRGTDQAGKSPNTEGKLHFARTFSGQRYFGLSFDNYFARYFDQCSCGARTYGLFDECTCDLGKCTFEFRLFNTTANTVKLHAYLAMCQALVAKAIDMEEIKDQSLFPALDFVKSRVSDMHTSTRRKMNREWEKRIVFVNEQLPLTPEEKKSIHYCIMNSEMGKTVTNADILLETEDN